MRKGELTRPVGTGAGNTDPLWQQPLLRFCFFRAVPSNRHGFFHFAPGVNDVIRRYCQERCCQPNLQDHHDLLSFVGRDSKAGEC